MASAMLPAALSPNSRRLAQVVPSPRRRTHLLSDETETEKVDAAGAEVADEELKVRTAGAGVDGRAGGSGSSPRGISSPRFSCGIPDVDRHAGGSISSNRSVGGGTAATVSESGSEDGALAEEITPDQEEALAAALLEEVTEQCDVIDGLVAEAELDRASEHGYEEETDSEDYEHESEMLAKLATTYARVDEQLRLLTQKLGEAEASEMREAERADLLGAVPAAYVSNGSDQRHKQLHGVKPGQSGGTYSGWLPDYCVLM